MGELVAWVLGLGLGYTMRRAIKTPLGLCLTVASVIVVGSLVTLAAGELWSEPWLILVDVGQVAVASVLGAFVLPGVLARLRRIARTS
jgi:hypothetical protein